jgi:hypothetical protein
MLFIQHDRDPRLCVGINRNSDRFPGNTPLQSDFRDVNALFCALGWYMGIELIRQCGKARNDIKLANSDVYIILHAIGKELFLADIVEWTRTSPSGYATQVYKVLQAAL